jgi:hypothetical protein
MKCYLASSVVLLELELRNVYISDDGNIQFPKHRIFLNISKAMDIIQHSFIIILLCYVIKEATSFETLLLRKQGCLFGVRNVT